MKWKKRVGYIIMSTASGFEQIRSFILSLHEKKKQKKTKKQLLYFFLLKKNALRYSVIVLRVVGLFFSFTGET